MGNARAQEAVNGRGEQSYRPDGTGSDSLPTSSPSPPASFSSSSCYVFSSLGDLLREHESFLSPARLLSAFLTQVRIFPLFRNQTQSTETRIAALSRALWDRSTSLVPAAGRRRGFSQSLWVHFFRRRVPPYLICLHPHSQLLCFAQDCPEAPGAAGTGRSCRASAMPAAGSSSRVGACFSSERASRRMLNPPPRSL